MQRNIPQARGADARADSKDVAQDRTNLRANESNAAPNRTDIRTDRSDIAQGQANLRTERRDMTQDRNDLHADADNGRSDRQDLRKGSPVPTQRVVQNEPTPAVSTVKTNTHLTAGTLANNTANSQKATQKQQLMQKSWYHWVW